MQILLKIVTSLFDAFPEATECINFIEYYIHLFVICDKLISNAKSFLFSFRVLSESKYDSASIVEDLQYTSSPVHKPDTVFLCESWEIYCTICENSTKDIRRVIEIIYNPRELELLSSELYV